ncbi:MAG TPA: hypothetical protein VM347_05865 [Nonomuraea sp.]|nr:hypothetical protein [Nonomuraea sp.]
MIRYIRTFLPWIAFAVISTKDDSRWGALAGFAAAAVLIALDRKAGRAWDALVIELSSTLYFGGLAIAAFALDPAPLGSYGAALSIAWLALTSWLSLLIRKPFTLGIARTMVPREVWSSPLFYRTNAIITAAWALSFTVEAALLALLVDSSTSAIIAVKVAGFVLPAIFTVRYSQSAHDRAGARRAT